jgi:prophage tail gpP-like protein
MPITVRRKTVPVINTPYAPQRAVLRVNGADYFEWESVSVRHALFESPPFTFQFTCSEQSPWPESWAVLRIRPPDECAVFLDGQLAIVGQVVTRQVYYDARQHTVQIQGIGRSGVLSYGGIKETQTREWTNVDIVELARAVATPYGIDVVPGPGLDMTKFPRASAAPNERAFDFLERYARQTKTMLTSDPDGNLVLLAQARPGGDVMIEGVNIRTGREVIHSLSAGQEYRFDGSGPGNDETWGAPANQRHTELNSTNLLGAGMPYLPRLVMSEIPAFSVDQLKARARIEDNVDQGNMVNVELTALGWQRPSGGLWEIAQEVVVKSPMLIMDGPLILRSVTFSQDNNSGTISTLDLVNQTAFSGFEQVPTGAGETPAEQET